MLCSYTALPITDSAVSYKLKRESLVSLSGPTCVFFLNILLRKNDLHVVAYLQVNHLCLYHVYL